MKIHDTNYSSGLEKHIFKKIILIKKFQTMNTSSSSKSTIRLEIFTQFYVQRTGKKITFP